MARLLGRVLVLAALSTLGLATPARAQWTNPYTHQTWNNPGSSLVDTMLYNRMQRDLLLKSMKKEGGQAGDAAEPAARATRTTFRPSPGSRVPEEFSASLLAGKADRAELTRYLRQVLGAYASKAMQEKRPNDLGHALTFFVAVNYLVLHGDDVSDEAMAAANRQLDALLASSANLAKAGDRQKQQLAEYFVCSAGFVLAGYQQGKEKADARQVKQYQELAAQNLKLLLQVEADQIRLTDAGLQLR
jgi:hypothetical protein